MKEKISVIVPVYGVEKVLKRCVDSILAQTYENLEIILVDDGSPDRCPRICDAYAEKYPNIVVVHKKKRRADFRMEGGSPACFGRSDRFCRQ